jgi:tRNA/tmRNA/rRNA uracil-C5-methylase (TrmA/RlmC/RlmD family)
MVFLQQLIEFKPLTIVYVSCNVHTQARDVGWFLQVAKAAGINYTLESLRGFDLFPQVSSIALPEYGNMVLWNGAGSCVEKWAG